MKSSLSNPGAFNKWMKDEEIEFKEPPIQEDMKEVSTSQAVSYRVKLVTFYFMLYYFPPSGKITIYFP